MFGTLLKKRLKHTIYATAGVNVCSVSDLVSLSVLFASLCILAGHLKSLSVLFASHCRPPQEL